MTFGATRWPLPLALAVAVALVPAVVVHLSLALGIGAGTLPGCYPMLDGCMSISATGRAQPSVYLFKPAFTLLAAVLAVLWIMTDQWIRLLATNAARGPGGAAGDRALRRRRVSMLALGLTASASLVLYVTMLGSDTELYRFMRRFGIYGYFAGTVFAQILLAGLMLTLAREPGRTALRFPGLAILLLAGCPFLLGALNLALKAVLAEPDRVENAIEWWVAAMMQACWLLVALAWRDTRFTWRIEPRIG